MHTTDAMDTTEDRIRELLETESAYQRCSEYLLQNRLTVAFEVVTSVLGDHGARPMRDHLVLTAVAHRPTGRFLATHEMIQFATKF